MSAVWTGLCGWAGILGGGLLVGLRISSYRKCLAAREAARFGLEPADMWWAGDPQ